MTYKLPNQLTVADVDFVNISGMERNLGSGIHVPQVQPADLHITFAINNGVINVIDGDGQTHFAASVKGLRDELVEKGFTEKGKWVEFSDRLPATLADKILTKLFEKPSTLEGYAAAVRAVAGKCATL